MGGGPLTYQPSAAATTPTQPRAHTSPIRGLDATPSSPLFEGRFGRMFRNLPVFQHKEDSLKTLAARMFEAEETGADGADELDNPDIPAGYTYLGQFIDHDITFDPASSLQRQNDPDALTDFRTPRFDLDSLYGRGPADTPFLYDQNPTNPDLAGKVFLRGRNVGNGFDLPRNIPGKDGRALIGDPRNDENLIISQLQCAFLRFHNKVVEQVASTTPLRDDNLFKEAQRQVRWHYQWVVVHDFLGKHIVGEDVVGDILASEPYRAGKHSVKLVKPKLRFYHWHEQPFMPVEFSVAVYRFGHSMIRDDYRFNDVVTDPKPIFSDSSDELANLNGFRPLPDKWGFDWKFFFDMKPDHVAQRSHLIDAKLARPLETLPPKVAHDPSSLAERNLLRGLRMGLPSGQAVARVMGVPPLSDDDLAIGQLVKDSEEATKDFVDNAPLWYYVLKEAEVLADGKRLGPVGGRIVAEVLIGLLSGDPLSYLRVEPNWTPTLGDNGRFDMPDLLRFAGF